jgi:aldose 1-epimerase
MNASNRTVELRSADVVVTVEPGAGGRIGQIAVGPQKLLCDDPTGGAIAWGSYPMAPWAGRLRDGRFTSDGTTHQLALNHTDEDGTRHAIHGTVFDAEWTVDEVAADAITLHCPLDAALGWPFAGTARQTIILAADRVSCRLRVDTDGDPFPASIGWHPWFRKPDRLTFAPEGMYARDGIGLPGKTLVPPVAGPWDDCFVNQRPVTLHYDRSDHSAVTAVTVTSDCDHWVVYDQPAHATCVEPQSGPPDALNVVPVLVRPGEPLSRRMRIAWSR